MSPFGHSALKPRYILLISVSENLVVTQTNIQTGKLEQNSLPPSILLNKNQKVQLDISIGERMRSTQ